MGVNWVQRINPAWFLAGAAFFLPIKPAPVNLFLLLAFVTALFFKEIHLNLLMLLKHPVTLSAFALVCFLFFTALYPGSDSQLAGDYATKYLRFAFIPMIAAVLMTTEKPSRLLDWFSLGVFLSVLASYGAILGLLESDLPTYFKAYLTHSFFVAIACSWAVYRIFFSPELNRRTVVRTFIAIGVLLSLVNLFVFVPGRSGWMTALLIPFLLGLRVLGVRKGLLIGFGLFCIALLLFAVSDVVRLRVVEVFSEFHMWSSGDPQTKETSLGQRMLYLTISLGAIQTSPWFGHGLGGVVAAVSDAAISKNFEPFQNPHNQYLMLLLQGGFVALGLYLVMIVAILKTMPGNVIAWLAIVVYLTNNLINSFHYDFSESLFFAVIIGLALAETLKKKASPI